MSRASHLRRSGMWIWTWAALLLLWLPREAFAQSPNWAFDSKVLYVGELANFYHAGGAKPHVGGIWGLEYPAWHRYTNNQVGQGLWVTARNFKDEQGTVWPHKTAQIGFRTNGADEVFPQVLESTIRFDVPPLVYVDGLQSFKHPTFYEHTDPDMPATATVTNEVNTLIGLTMERTVLAFSNEHHDNYHVIEYVFTNTGNTDDDDEIELNQVLEEVYIAQLHSYAVNEQAASIGSGGGWGRDVMNDVVGDGLKSYETDFRAQFSWLGKQASFTEWNTIGGPVLSDRFRRIFEGDSVGRLSAAHMVGFVTLHADRAAGDETDDPGQPSATGYINNGALLTTTRAHDREKMALQYALLEAGHTGSHADFVVGPPRSDPEPVAEWRARMASQTRDVGTNISGELNFTGYGPYTLAPGESVRIVQAEGVAGLSPMAAMEIGKAYKAAHLAGEEDRPIPFDANGDGQIDPETERMSKNLWVMTTRDSLFKTFERARANFRSGFQIPRPPPPPREFRITSGPDRIVLEWDTYAGANPVGFEVYRAAERLEGDYTGYDLIAGVEALGPEARRYEDTSVQRGISYYYYIQAVGQPNQDDTALTPTGIPLKSNRAFSQSYDPAFLKRPPGGTLSDVRIVPNPYNLAAAQEIRWPDQQDRVGFLDVPGRCTIRIYTELGQLVETIEHTDGSGDAFWDMTTSSNQVVVTGLYLVVIQDHDSGDQLVKKLVVVR